VRDSDEWYTPQRYVESARRVMGSIDLDPFSSATANATVRATYYLCPEHSALTYPWRNHIQRHRYPSGLNVWMNPPYSVALLGAAVKTFVRHLETRDVAQAIVLVNNCTDTQWFRALQEACQAVCFPRHRIAFVAPDGKSISGTPRGQAFFYYGTENGCYRFRKEFATYGWTIDAYAGWRGLV
jgi:hypothetical protein